MTNEIIDAKQVKVIRIGLGFMSVPDLDFTQDVMSGIDRVGIELDYTAATDLSGTDREKIAYLQQTFGGEVCTVNMVTYIGDEDCSPEIVVRALGGKTDE